MSIKQIFLFLFLCFIGFLFILPYPSGAFTVRSADNVTIQDNERIPDTLLTSGQNIIISGDVEGDVFCAGQTVRVTGTVSGDVICAAQTITILGTVDGDVRVAAQTLRVEGTVQRNVTAFAQELLVTPDATIAGEVLTAVQNLLVEGTVNRQLLGSAQRANISGNLGDSVNLQVENLSVQQGASISGDLIYKSEREASIASQGAVQGSIRRSEPEAAPPATDEGNQVALRFFSLFSFLALGLGLAFLFPTPFQKVASLMREKSLASFGWGIITLILTPLLIGLLFITLIGIPSAIILLLLYIIALIVSRLFVALLVGEWIKERLAWSEKTSFISSVVIGVLVSWILFALPVIGGFMSLLFIIFGLGGVFLGLKSLISSRA